MPVPSSVVMDRLRLLKHRYSRRRGLAQWARYMDRVGAERARVAGHTWRFSPGKYTGTCVAGVKPEPAAIVAPLPRRIFTVWAGLNEMPEARKRCLEVMRDVQSGLEVVLVTAENLSDWVVPEDPLPRCFPALSAVDKSDLLRAYLLHHHGGGYSDIKLPLASWTPVFDELDGDPSLYGAGYASRGDIGVAPQPLDLDMRVHAERVCGMAALVLKPRSQFTGVLLQGMTGFLRPIESEIIRHPGGIMGQADNPLYPVQWSQLARMINQVSYALSDYMLRTETLELNLDLRTYR